jgi:glycerol uptake facilitator-like aquaporin
MQVTAARKLVAEGLGTALLVAAVVGSGSMAQRLAHDPALALLCNTIASGSALVAILLTFGPISGAQLNPAVTVCMAITRDLTPAAAVGYIAVQIVGGIAGAIAANAMVDLAPAVMSTTVRSGFPKLLSEGIATFGLIGVVLAVGRTRASMTPVAVAAYLVAAYWFTASTSFANPAVTVARAFSDTYAGIRLADVAGFIGAQAIGAALGAVLFVWLVPLDSAVRPRDAADRSVPPIPVQKRWAVVRVVLGTAQVCSATLSLWLVLQLGSASPLTLWAASATASLTLTNFVLFRHFKLAG